MTVADLGGGGGAPPSTIYFHFHAVFGKLMVNKNTYVPSTLVIPLCTHPCPAPVHFYRSHPHVHTSLSTHTLWPGACWDTPPWTECHSPVKIVPSVSRAVIIVKLSVPSSRAVPSPLGNFGSVTAWSSKHCTGKIADFKTRHIANLRTSFTKSKVKGDRPKVEITTNFISFRLTPVYMFVLLFYVSLTLHMISGPWEVIQ